MLCLRQKERKTEAKRDDKDGNDSGGVCKAGNIAIEIKTAIPSLGELVRQIRMYQTYLKVKFIIVCPDDRFAEPLRSQGIHFYKYNNNF